MKGLVIILALLFAVPGFSKAQYLNQLYDHDSSGDWGYSVFVKPDGDYFVLGGAQKNGWGVISKTISPVGTEIQKKQALKIPGTFSLYEGNPGGVKQLPAGDYLIPLSLTRPDGPNNIIGLSGLCRIKPNGDTVWVKWYSDSTQLREFSNDCNLMPDGGCIVASIKGNLHVADARLRRTDSNGNLLWTAQHTTEGFYTCEYIGDGKILVGASKTRLEWIGMNFWYYPAQPRFLIYDTSGNLLKDTLYSTRFSGGGKIYKDRNGGYFHWGALDTLLYPSEPSNINNFPEYVAHLDDSFRVTWLKHFATSKADRKYIWNVKQLKDGNYLLIGKRADTSFKPEPVDQGWAMKLDRNGFVIWEGHYYLDTTGSTNWLVDAAERPDGSIVMTGSARHNNAGWRRQDVWVVVVDSMGCIIPNCAPTSVQALSSIPSPELVLYPNPTNGNFTVETGESGSLTIISIHGQQVATYRLVKGGNTVRLESLAAGVYVANFKGDLGKICRGKLVYQP